MTTKLLIKEINRCRVCPHLAFLSAIGYHCRHKDLDGLKQQIENIDDVPDWCPLPTKEEPK